MANEQLQRVEDDNNDLLIDPNLNAHQFLTFMLNGEEYGIDILKVQGIQGWGRVTPIPNTPDYMLGVINLRGEVVPIVDLRKRFSIETATYGPTTVIIVVRVANANATRTVGMVVDDVSEVYNVPEQELQLPPNMASTISGDFIKAFVILDKKMVILLEIDNLINGGVMAHMPGDLIAETPKKKKKT